jgi:hypothetical protein
MMYFLPEKHLSRNFLPVSAVSFLGLLTYHSAQLSVKDSSDQVLTSLKCMLAHLPPSNSPKRRQIVLFKVPLDEKRHKASVYNGAKSYECFNWWHLLEDGVPPAVFVFFHDQSAIPMGKNSLFDSAF